MGTVARLVAYITRINKNDVNDCNTFSVNVKDVEDANKRVATLKDMDTTQMYFISGFSVVMRDGRVLINHGKEEQISPLPHVNQFILF